MDAGLRNFMVDDQGQADLLKEALSNARNQAFLMKRYMDQGELSGVLKHAAELLRELRTSLLSPKNYYQLYMQILDELRHLENYFEDLHKSGTTMKTLYERVQSSGNVLPRLYLLVTVGSVYIKTKEAPAREILMDLVEMAKGVQYPLRGLFLRNYLSLCVKDKLPDIGSEYEGDGGSVQDSLNFLLQNFSETNRLWIRIQTQTNTVRTGDNSYREKERQELRLLVGTSLVRLSQMEGVTLRVYSEEVLPRILEIIVNCQDKIAQEYLMDCIIQVFPDEFHLQNLKKILIAITELKEEVDTATILLTLFTRLCKYQKSSGGKLFPGETEVSQAKVREEMFQLVLDCVQKVTQRKKEQFEHQLSTINSNSSDTTLYVATTEAFFGLFVGFAEFVLHCFDTDRVGFGQKALEPSLAFLNVFEQKSFVLVEKVRALVQVIMDQMALEAMKIDVWIQLIAWLPWSTRKLTVLEFVRVLLKKKIPLERTEDVEKLMEVLIPLIKDDPDQTIPPLDTLSLELEMEQQTLSRLVHAMQNTNFDVLFQMYTITRRSFGQGGVFRIRYTLVPLIFASLKFSRELFERDQRGDKFSTTPREVLQFVHEMVTALASKLDQMSVTCVNLFLQCALVADTCGFEAIAYEFITQAFIVYEDQITHSRDQIKALDLIVTSLCASKKFSSTNYEVLATKTTQHCAKLLKKNEQCSMVLSCAHLFWNSCHKDGKRVLECLQRSLRIADSCASSSSSYTLLFVEILEAYIYFFEAEVPEVAQHYLAGLIALVKEHLENMELGQERNEGEGRFRQILHYVESKSIPITTPSSTCNENNSIASS